MISKLNTIQDNLQCLLDAGKSTGYRGAVTVSGLVLEEALETIRYLKNSNECLEANEKELHKILLEKNKQLSELYESKYCKCQFPGLPYNGTNICNRCIKPMRGLVAGSYENPSAIVGGNIEQLHNKPAFGPIGFDKFQAQQSQQDAMDTTPTADGGVVEQQDIMTLTFLPPHKDSKIMLLTEEDVVRICREEISKSTINGITRAGLPYYIQPGEEA